MTTFTYDERLVSDFYKDVYGFRPHAGFWDVWESADENGRQAIWDNLIEAHEREMKRYNLARQQAIVDFEGRVSDVINLGAQDRATAIRWISESLDADSDNDYLEYYYELPYGYINRTTVMNQSDD